MSFRWANIKEVSICVNEKLDLSVFKEPGGSGATPTPNDRKAFCSSVIWMSKMNLVLGDAYASLKIVIINGYVMNNRDI